MKRLVQLLKISGLVFFTCSSVIAHCSTTIYMVRHGQTDWNHQKIIQGRSDIPLNEKGRNEAAVIARELSHISFDVCYTSSLQRARETASIILDSNPFHLTTDDRLIERSFGSLEGKTGPEFNEASPEEKSQVESNNNIQKRVFESLEEIARRHDDQTVLIVSHAGVMRNVMGRINGLNEEQTERVKIYNCAIIKLKKTEQGWEILEAPIANHSL